MPGFKVVYENLRYTKPGLGNPLPAQQKPLLKTGCRLSQVAHTKVDTIMNVYTRVLSIYTDRQASIVLE